MTGQCTPFPDGKLCADPECTYGGTSGTHWCKDVSDIVCPGLAQKWQDHARWELDTRFGKKTVDDLRAAWEKLERKRIVGPLGGGGWHHVLAHYRHARLSDAAKHIWGGRCQSGKRWFWYVSTYSYDQEERHCDDPVCSNGMTGHEYGWGDAEDDAVAAYADACVRLGGMDPRLCRTPGPPGRASAAAAALKQINAAKRKARPPKTGAVEAAPVEYLYEPWSWSDYDNYPYETHKGIREIPIVKKTAKRIYYDNRSRWDREDGVVTLGYIDREEFETDTRCRDTCPVDVTVPRCSEHRLSYPHCVHVHAFSGRWKARYEAHRENCPRQCPLDTTEVECTKHGYTWEHCPHGRGVGDCWHGGAAGVARLPYSSEHHGGGTVYATREAAEERLYARERKRAEAEPELKRLRMAMADAHPDRGGTNEGFIAARETYKQAMREAS